MNTRQILTLDAAPRFCLGAAFSVVMVGGIMAALAVLAALGVGLVEW